MNETVKVSLDRFLELLEFEKIVNENYEFFGFSSHWHINKRKNLKESDVLDELNRRNKELWEQVILLNTEADTLKAKKRFWQ